MSTPRAQTLNRLFSIGYVAKGIVYVLVGGLTLATVLGFSAGSGGVDGPRAVLDWLAEQPLGRFLVGALGVGLIAYAVWRFYRAGADPAGEGHDAKGGAKRVGYAASGLANGLLGVVALLTAFGSGAGSGSGGATQGGTSQQGMVARLLEQDWGVWLVGIVGAGVIAAGLYQFVKAVRAEFVDDIHWRVLSRETVKNLGRWGFFARGLVFGIVGYFLVVAAVRSNASSYRGTEGALEWLSTHSYGVWLLGLTSAGLLLFGVYSVLKGRYGSIADA